MENSARVPVRVAVTIWLDECPDPFCPTQSFAMGPGEVRHLALNPFGTDDTQFVEALVQDASGIARPAWRMRALGRHVPRRA